MRLYGRFWDILSVLIFSIAALSVIVTDWGALTWQHWLVAGLTLAQGMLYIFAIARCGWPIPRRWLATYFIGGLSLWVIVATLRPDLWWIGMTYFGQMFGLLPPRAVIAGTLIINVLVILQLTDWNPASAPPGLLMGFAFQWLGAMAVFLFINSIASTSQERGHLVAQLEAAQEELKAAREKDVELAALRERERLARDLHDSLGHALVAISVQLEAIQRLYRVDPERGSQHVDELKVLTRRATDDLRRSLAGLRAPGLGERPLHEALQALSVEVGQRAHLAVECQAAPEADALSPAVAETVWRVAQESLVNVERHARARHVKLDLSLPPGAAVLCVQDDGVGLQPSAEDLRGHYGLRGMRERVEGLGGTLTVRAAEGGGTRVEARLPVIERGLN
jgi:signal transduction histidine kinase